MGCTTARTIYAKVALESLSGMNRCLPHDAHLPAGEEHWSECRCAKAPRIDTDGSLEFVADAPPDREFPQRSRESWKFREADREVERDDRRLLRGQRQAKRKMAFCGAASFQ